MLNEQRVLDLYAGTGALGLEALSRGAATVTFVECDRAATAALASTVERLGVADRCVIVRERVETALRGRLPNAPFGYVLADPPYAEPVAVALMRALTGGPNLAAEARVVLERESATPLFEPPGGPIRLERSERYGRTRLDFYRFEPKSR